MHIEKLTHNFWGTLVEVGQTVKAGQCQKGMGVQNTPFLSNAAQPQSSNWFPWYLSQTLRCVADGCNGWNVRSKVPHPVVDQLTLILMERWNVGQIKNGFSEIFKILRFCVSTLAQLTGFLYVYKIGPVLFLHNLWAPTTTRIYVHYVVL